LHTGLSNCDGLQVIRLMSFYLLFVLSLIFKRALLLHIYKKLVEDMVRISSHRTAESDTLHGTNWKVLLQVSLLVLFKQFR
jgi:hypothetical protein